MGSKKRPNNRTILPGPSTSNARIKEQYDLAYYVHDRVELLQKAFSLLSSKELKAIAPSSVSKLSDSEIQELCLEELLGISSKRLCAILDGVEPPSNSESSSTSNSSEEEESETDTQRSRTAEKDKIETVCLDTDSGDESSKESYKRSKTSNVKRSDRKRKMSSSIAKGSVNDMQKADRAGVTVLELLELQARARAIRAQLNAQGTTSTSADRTDVTRHTVAESDHRADKSGDDDDEPVEVKEEVAVIEISSDEEKPKIEEIDDENESSIVNKKSQRKKFTEKGNVSDASNNSNKSNKLESSTTKQKKLQRKSKEKDTDVTSPYAITRVSDSLNANDVTSSQDNAADVVTITETDKAQKPKEKHKKSKNKSSKKKKAKEKEKTSIVNEPIKDSIYENDEQEKESRKECNVVEDKAVSDDDVVEVIPDKNDFTVVRKVDNNKHNENATTNTVIVRKIQFDNHNDNVVISVPNVTNKNVKIVNKTTKKLTSAVSKVKSVKEKKKLNSTVSKVTSNSNKGKRKKKIANKVVRTESCDDGINLELSDSEKLEMEYLCSDIAQSDHEGSDTSDGITVVLNKNKTCEYSDKCNTNEQVDSDLSLCSKIRKSSVNTVEKAKLERQNNTPVSDVVENVDQDKEVVETHEKEICFDKSNESSVISVGKNNENNNFNNINVSEIKTLDVSCIEDIPLVSEGPDLPVEEDVLQTGSIKDSCFLENKEVVTEPNDNVDNSNCDSNSSSVDSEEDSESETNNDSNSEDDNLNAKECIDGNNIKSNKEKKSPFNLVEKENNSEVENPVSKVLNDDDRENTNNDNETCYMKKTVNSTDTEPIHFEKRELSDGEITDSSTDIELLDLKPEVVCISDADDDGKTSFKKIKEKKHDDQKQAESLCSDKLSEDSTGKNIQNDTIKPTLEMNKPLSAQYSETEEILELSDDSSCYEVEGISVLSKEPTAEEIEALSARIDDIERIEVVTDEQIQQHEAKQKDTEKLTEAELESIANTSWKDRYLDSKKVKKVMSTANILNAMRKKNIDLKKKIEEAKKKDKQIQEQAEVEQVHIEIGSIEHYNILQGSTKYVNPVLGPEGSNQSIEKDLNTDIVAVTDRDNLTADNTDQVPALTVPESNLTKEMKKDAKLLLKMYKRLLKYNDINKKKTIDPKKKKKKKLKKNKLKDSTNI